MLIQKLRLQHGWSQEQLAELAGVSPRTIQRIESGRPASVETLKALAAVFEVDFASLQEPEMSVDSSNPPLPPQPEASGAFPAGVSQDEALALAHVRKLRGFYMHVAQYVAVIAALSVINLLTSPHYFWAIWPALGWGLGIMAHGLQVWEKAPFLGGDWERRQVEKRLGRRL